MNDRKATKGDWLSLLFFLTLIVLALLVLFTR